MPALLGGGGGGGGGSREALPSPRDMESIKLHWQHHGAYVVLDGIFLSQVPF